MCGLTKYTIAGKPVYSLSSRFLTIKGKEYECYGGHSTGKGYHDTVYYLRDLTTGQKFEATMEKLIKTLLAEQTEKLTSLNRVA